MTRAPLEVDVAEAVRAYFRAVALAEPVQVALWKSAGVTVTQLAVLKQLRQGPQPAGQLGRMVGLSPASITHMLDRLEERGLVSRQRSVGDRRCVEVQPTEEGLHVVGDASLVRGTPIAEAMQAMPAERRRQLAGLLDELVANVHQLTMEGQQ